MELTYWAFAEEDESRMYRVRENPDPIPKHRAFDSDIEYDWPELGNDVLPSDWIGCCHATTNISRAG